MTNQQPNQQQPIYILPEGALRTKGRDAQRVNIMAARAVADTVRTTLGPKGMDKMLVDSIGDVVITNDGVTILEEMEIEHTAARMMVEDAKTQEVEVGDGTTTAVVVAGELLKKAEELLDQEVHPSVIAKGYRLAEIKAREILQKLGQKIERKDKITLKKIAITAMTGKSAENAREKLANIVVDAIMQVEDGNVINLDNIKIEKKTGGSTDDSELIQGILIDKDRVHPNMPRRLENPKILLLDVALEIKETENDAQIRITSPDQLRAFIDQEHSMLKEMIEKVISIGANAVLCQKGIDDTAQYFLAKKGIFAARRVKRSDIEKLSKATGANIVSNLDEMSAKDLGTAGVVEEQKISGESMTYVKDCKFAKAVTILVRGATDHVVDETERAITDALGDLRAVIENQMIVAGGGAPEMELSRELSKYAESLTGREQLAVMSFAKSMEVIPRTLAENAGIDPINTIADLKSKHDAGKRWYGVDVLIGKPSDMWELGVIEPLKVKTQAISSASEVAVMILRIDDVIAASKLSKGSSMPPGGMPDMGDM